MMLLWLLLVTVHAQGEEGKLESGCSMVCRFFVHLCKSGMTISDAKCVRLVVSFSAPEPLVKHLA